MFQIEMLDKTKKIWHVKYCFDVALKKQDKTKICLWADSLPFTIPTVFCTVQTNTKQFLTKFVTVRFNFLSLQDG